MNLATRLLQRILRFFIAVFNIPIRLKFVVVLLLLTGGGIY